MGVSAGFSSVTVCPISQVKASPEDPVTLYDFPPVQIIYFLPSITSPLLNIIDLILLLSLLISETGEDVNILTLFSFIAKDFSKVTGESSSILSTAELSGL